MKEPKSSMPSFASIICSKCWVVPGIGNFVFKNEFIGGSFGRNGNAVADKLVWEIKGSTQSSLDVEE